MAALTKLRRAADEELSVIAPVRRVAGPAIFFNRWMFPEVRTALFRVACIAKFVDRSGLDELLLETAMLIMAVRAFHFTFLDGVVRLLGNLHAQIAMAGETQFGLRCLQVHPLSGVNRMAVVTGHSGRFVFAHVPVSQCPGLGMTLETLGRFCCSVDFLVPENEDIDPAAAALLNMGFTVTMAGFAAFGIGWTFMDGFFRMGRIDVGVVVSLMTRFAHFYFAALFRTRNVRWGHHPTCQDRDGKEEKNQNFFLHCIPL